MAVCRLIFFDFAYKIGRISKNGNERYDDLDIYDCIAYAKWLIELGYKDEPHDDFNLQDFVDWAKKKL